MLLPNCICALKLRFQIIVKFWQFRGRLKNKTSKTKKIQQQQQQKNKQTRNSPSKQVNLKDIRVWVALVLSVSLEAHSPSLQLPTWQPLPPGRIIHRVLCSLSCFWQPTRDNGSSGNQNAFQLRVLRHGMSFGLSSPRRRLWVQQITYKM